MNDIDERFEALTAQISHVERREMVRAATRQSARLPRSRRRRRLWIAALVAAVMVAGAGVLVTYRPELVDQIRVAFSG
ncbi:hypothetical protein [Streptosporangium sp. NPDC000396]|uniref:hypothetical protein n=1 Tax=Streptosporangium sp. NPDC000396 TaxID=3366185 RepID=UPI0036AB9443